jgi:hypothetical protein
LEVISLLASLDNSRYNFVGRNNAVYQPNTICFLGACQFTAWYDLLCFPLPMVGDNLWVSRPWVSNLH